MNEAVPKQRDISAVAAQWVAILRVKAGGEETRYHILTTCQMPSEKQSTAGRISVGW